METDISKCAIAKIKQVPTRLEGMETYDDVSFSGGNQMFRPDLRGWKRCCNTRRGKMELRRFRPDLRGWKRARAHNSLGFRIMVPTRLEGMETLRQQLGTNGLLLVPTRLEGMETDNHLLFHTIQMSFRPDLRGWKLGLLTLFRLGILRSSDPT